MKRFTRAAIQLSLSVFAMISLPTLFAQQSLTAINTSYTVDFNAMGSNATASLPTGFKIGSDWSTGATSTTYAAGTTGTGAITSNSAGGNYNWADGITSSSTDRALGFLSSGSVTLPRSIIYAFTNNTGQTVTSLTVSWTYEKYRSGSNPYAWTFFHGSNGAAVNTSNSSGDLAYTADASNTIIFNPPSASAKAFTIAGLTIANGASYYLRWTYSGSNGNTNGQGLAIDNFSIALNRPVCTTPSVQPLSLQFTSPTTSSIGGSFTASTPNADGYLVLASDNSVLTANPSDGASYQAGDAIGDAVVVSTGTGTSFTASSLNASTQYYFFVFSYNSECSNGPKYNTTSPLTGNETTAAGIAACATPSNLVTGLSLNKTTTSISGTFTAAASTDEYLVVLSTSSSLTGSPVNGVVYTPGQTAFGGTVVQVNSSTNFLATSLSPAIQYYVYVFSVNSQNCTGGPTYSVSSVTANTTTDPFPACSGITLTTQPSSLNFTITSSSVSGNFSSAAGADHYLVISSTSASLNTNPVNGQNYAAGAALGNGTVVSYSTTTNFSATGLSSGTTYYFFVFSAVSNCSGSPSAPLYYTSSAALQGSATTTSASYSYYFGNFHSHTGYSDGNKDGNSPTPTEAYNFAKTATGMDFLGVSEHNHTAAGGSLSNYQNGVTKANNFNSTNNNFLALLGMEWGTISGGGHVLVYGDGFDHLIGWEPNEYTVYVAKSDYTGADGLFKVINDYAGSSSLAILAHPSTADFNSLSSAAYSSSVDDALVGVALETGPAFSTNTTYSDPGTSMSYLSYYQKLLAKGYRVGPVIDHDNHYTTFGKTTYSRTAVIATSLTRTGIIDAMRSMRFYATQDYDAKVEFTINGRVMGADFTDRYAPVINIRITDIAHAADLSSAVIKVMYGTPGSNVTAAKLIQSTGNTYTYTNSTQLNNTTIYYYLDITIGTKRIITAPIWYKRDDNTALPVKLSSFSANRINSKVKLNWVTEQEVNSSHFIIERSSNGIKWDSIMAVRAAGNSSTSISYQAYDDSPMSGYNFYRLRQIDLDGKVEYSSVKKLFFVDPGTLTVSPNPAEDLIEIRFSKVSESNRKIQVVDLNGKVLSSLESLNSTTKLNIASLSKGEYFIRVYTKGGVLTAKFLKLK